MWRVDECEFDPRWFNHSEECDESRMFFTRVKDQTDKAILFEHPQGYDFLDTKKRNHPSLSKFRRRKLSSVRRSRVLRLR